MNNLKFRLIWYINSLVYSNAIFFIMLFFVIVWVGYSNIYIKKNYIEIINKYEELIDHKVMDIKDQSFPKSKDIDLYSLIVSEAEKNNIDIKSYIMNKKNFIFSLVGSTDEIRNFIFKINDLSDKDKLKINKIDLSFEEINKTGLVLEVQSYDK